MNFMQSQKMGSYLYQRYINARVTMLTEKLKQSIQEKKAPICADLSITLKDIPQEFKDYHYNYLGKGAKEASYLIYMIGKEIIDNICDIAPLVIIPIENFEMLGVEGIHSYISMVQYAKRKGMFVIGELSGRYPFGHIGAIDIDGKKEIVYQTDMVTVKPDLLGDEIFSLIEKCRAYDKAILIEETEKFTETKYVGIIKKEGTIHFVGETITIHNIVSGWKQEKYKGQTVGEAAKLMLIENL